MLSRMKWAAPLVWLLLAGCGGAPDLGGGRSAGLGGDLGGNYSGRLGGGYGFQNAGGPQAGGVTRGVYPMVETSFQLPEVKTDPFAAEVWAIIQTPDSRTVRVPAFYDGENTWRVRYTPDHVGKHTITVKIGPLGQEQAARVEKLDHPDFEATGQPSSGFAGRDPNNAQRFVLSNGDSYYPIGHNAAWRDERSGDLPALFAKMGAAGENWTRVWMTHWDGKNLDWAQDKKIPPGEIDLEAAKRWDALVQAAEKSKLRFQMVLQHHGQYSSTVNPNWDENPWNAKNGGFLRTPADFFTTEKAKELTRRKYRYIVARWGWSPAIMAWELFNEVENTDAWRNKLTDDVARWHAEMADYLRKIDPYHHLITTSAVPLDSPVWQAMDYYQPHAYVADIPAAVSGLNAGDKKLDKPIFFGEIGPGGGVRDEDGRFLRRALWASLMADGAGTAQYWDWNAVEKGGLYKEFTAASAFAAAAGLASKRLAPAAPLVQTSARAALTFGPGAGWAKAKLAEFTVPANGQAVAGLAGLPAFLHGDAKKVAEGYPPSAAFRVNAPQPTTFTLSVGTVAKAGAKARVLVDGQEAAAKEWPATADGKDFAVNAELTAKVPEGAHTVTVESAGADWFTVKSFSLSDYAPSLAALARANRDNAVLWVYHREGLDAPAKEPVSGKIALSGMKDGAYRIVWWDTEAGKLLREDTAHTAKGTLTLDTPPIARDLAAYVSPAGKSDVAAKKPEKKAKAERGKAERSHGAGK